jgi:hypothetical protein
MLNFLAYLYSYVSNKKFECFHEKFNRAKMIDNFYLSKRVYFFNEESDKLYVRSHSQNNWLRFKNLKILLKNSLENLSMQY